MNVIYSCVVDGDPKFIKQVQNLILSLNAVGVAGYRILVNLTPAALHHKDFLDGLGVNTCAVPFFADNRYCNKVVQLRNIPSGFDFVVCCDTDIMFLENIELHLESRKGKFLGKTVDLGNPPIERFRGVLALLDDRLSIPETLTDLDRQPTFQGNLNGGLYIIPGEQVSPFSKLWEHFSAELFSNPETAIILGKYAHHIDQMSFCCALHTLGADLETLPLEYNYPLHWKVPLEREATIDRVMVIHYHDAVDENHFPVTNKVQNDNLRQQMDLALQGLRESQLYLDMQAKSLDYDLSA
jgi:hypothetical protein